MKPVRIFVWLLSLVIAVGIGAMMINYYKAELEVRNSQAGKTIAQVGGDFTLTDHTGKVVTQADFADKPMVVYFGYTFCPDVCPTTLADMIIWTEALGEEADKLHYLFVTVDPERDTQELMEGYVTVFFDRLVGLRGTQEQTDSIIKAYRVYAKKVEDTDGGDYLMDHTASVYLMKKGNEFMGTISYGEEHVDAIAKLKKLIASAE